MDFTALDVNVLEQDFLAPHQTRQIKPKRLDVGLQFRVRFLERHEYARLAELRGAAHQEFRGKEGLAATRPAANQRGPPARQTAAGNFVETLDARGALGQMSFWRGGFVAAIFHSGASFVAASVMNSLTDCLSSVQ
jgi:hypothetical protein